MLHYSENSKTEQKIIYLYRGMFQIISYATCEMNVFTQLMYVKLFAQRLSKDKSRRLLIKCC